MSSKTISLDEEAYERLVARKQEGESFSDVVKRLAGERSWREVAGIWSEEADGDRELEELVREGRERSRNGADRIADELE